MERLKQEQSLQQIAKTLLLAIHAVIWQKGFFLDPGEIAISLLWWHSLADLEKMAQHHPLTIGAQLGGLDQRSVNFRRGIRRVGKELLQMGVLRVHFAAHFLALRQVGRVELGYALEFGIAQVELLFQPGELRPLTLLQTTGGRHASKVNAAVSRCCCNQTEHQNEHASLHGITREELDTGRGRGRNAVRVQPSHAQCPDELASSQQSRQ